MKHVRHVPYARDIPTRDVLIETLALNIVPMSVTEAVFQELISAKLNAAAP